MTDQSTAVAKPQVQTGGAIAALVPQSLDDAFRLAKALAMSGDMVPKHFQGKPEMTMAAIVRGMEIGLAPMQALSNIAVINGRASVWGDALPAMMQRAGHHVDADVTGEGDKMVATATLTRGDTGKTVTRTFSVEDAKKASLWGKAGPWQSYPKRMLLMRARTWAVRDGAADALMGLQVMEEVQDYQPIKDVTPKEGGFASVAMKARGEPIAEPQEQSMEAEVVSYATLDTEEAFPGSDAFSAGAAAHVAGQSIEDCPHQIGSQDAVDWCGGWTGSARASE